MMDLESIMLSVSQRKTNSVWFHLYVESEKQNKETKQNEKRLTDKENKWW